MVKKRSYPMDPVDQALGVLQRIASDSDEPGVWLAFLQVREAVMTGRIVPVLPSPVEIDRRTYPTGTPLDQVVAVLHRQYEMRREPDRAKASAYIQGPLR